MIQTIQLSSCISVQGHIVEVHPSGDVVIRSGTTLYRGKPVTADLIHPAIADTSPAPLQP